MASNRTKMIAQDKIMAIIEKGLGLSQTDGTPDEVHKEMCGQVERIEKTFGIIIGTHSHKHAAKKAT